MPNCAAFGCTSRSSNDAELSFHRVPSANKNNDCRKKWLSNIRRAGNLPKDSVICSKHFEPTCFQRDLRVII